MESAFATVTPLAATDGDGDHPRPRLPQVDLRHPFEPDRGLAHRGRAPSAGTPSLGIVAPQGLVLRIVRNGNYEIVARSIEPVDGRRSRCPAAWGELVDLPEYRARVTESWVTTVPVFERETINFGDRTSRPPLADDPAAARGPVCHYAGGTVVLRRVRLPEDLDDATIIAELVQYSHGDAYDRTGSVFVVPARARRRHA